MFWLAFPILFPATSSYEKRVFKQAWRESAKPLA